MIPQEKIDKSCNVGFLVSQKTSMKFNSWFGQFIPDFASRHYATVFQVVVIFVSIKFNARLVLSPAMRNHDKVISV